VFDAVNCEISPPVRPPALAQSKLVNKITVHTQRNETELEMVYILKEN